MPDVYRAIQKDNGAPKVCDLADCLGVRTEGKYADIRPDHEANVHPNAGGMSASIDDFKAIPNHRLPVGFGAGTSKRNCLWIIPSDQLPPRLFTRIHEPASDGAVKALVEPMETMSIVEYQTHLAASRDTWTEAPGGPG